MKYAERHVTKSPSSTSLDRLLRRHLGSHFTFEKNARGGVLKNFANVKCVLRFDARQWVIATIQLDPDALIGRC